MRPKLKASVVGVGTTAFGNFPELDEYDLGSAAFREALVDAGLENGSVDGLVTCRVPSYVRMAEVMGVEPRWTLPLPPHGRMSGIGIIEAAAALTNGMADCVALIYTNIGRSRRRRYGGSESPGIWDPWGFTSPGAAHALMFQRHRALYGTTTRQLAEVSVAIRHHASRNPSAVMREPITIDDHEVAPLIAAPLRLLDYCLINDGAVCIIIATNERAADCRKRPVRIAGTGARDTFVAGSLPNFDLDFWYDAVRSSSEEAHAMSGTSVGDIKALMAYDNFSPTVLFSLEGIGVCARGESGEFVEGGALRLDGRLPTNTDGGHLSNSYMQGWSLNVEAVRQIRGECGERQIPRCDVVQYVAATPCSRSIIYAAS